MTDNNDSRPTAAFYRDYIERQRGKGKVEPHPILAELNDEKARSAVAKLILAHDVGMVDGDFDDSKVKKLLKGHEAGLSMAEDVEQGNRSKLDFREGTGGNQNDVDVEPWRRYEQVKDLFRQEPRVADFTNNIFQCIIFSSAIPPTGRGKTNTMYTLTEFAQVVHPDIRVMSNNTSDPFETVPRKWNDLEESIREHDGWQLLLIDEAAQFLQYADQTAGKTVSQMLKLLRHNYCHLIMVGHTGRDIPADIRRQVFVLDKKSEKTGVLGYGITPQTDGDRMQVSEEVLKLQNIPETKVGYDDIDDEGIQIVFDDDDDEAGDDEEVVECAVPDCMANSEQYDEVAETGFCPYHDASDLPEDDVEDGKPHPEEVEDGEDHTERDNDVEFDAEKAVENARKTAQAAKEAADAGEDEDVYEVLARETGLDREEIEQAVVDRLEEENDESSS